MKVEGNLEGLKVGIFDILKSNPLQKKKTSGYNQTAPEYKGRVGETRKTLIQLLFLNHGVNALMLLCCANFLASDTDHLLSCFFSTSTQVVFILKPLKHVETSLVFMGSVLQSYRGKSPPKIPEKISSTLR